MTLRRELELEEAALRRARADWGRWYGSLDGFLERTGRRLIEVRRQLAELDKEETGEHEQQG